MNCPECGAYNSDHAERCQYCKCDLSNVPKYEQNQEFNREQSVSVSTDPYQGHSMKWYKFLIYFALFAGAVLNLINGITYLNGGQYGSSYLAERIYDEYNELKTVDVLMGWLCIGLAVYAIVTRFMLAGLKKSGPSLLLGLYLINIITTVVYIVAILIILSPLITFWDLMTFRTVVSFIFTVVMLFANGAYFDYRKELFVN